MTKRFPKQLHSLILPSVLIRFCWSTISPTLGFLNFFCFFFLSSHHLTMVLVCISLVTNENKSLSTSSVAYEHVLYKMPGPIHGPFPCWVFDFFLLNLLEFFIHFYTVFFFLSGYIHGKYLLPVSSLSSLFLKVTSDYGKFWIVI